jgi:hypothetical protein
MQVKEKMSPARQAKRQPRRYSYQVWGCARVEAKVVVTCRETFGGRTGAEGCEQTGAV